MEKKPTIWRKIDKVTENEEFIVKESRRNNISVLIHHHQDFRKDDTDCC